MLRAIRASSGEKKLVSIKFRSDFYDSYTRIPKLKPLINIHFRQFSLGRKDLGLVLSDIMVRGETL
jgi:hypothetical protein